MSVFEPHERQTDQGSPKNAPGEPEPGMSRGLLDNPLACCAHIETEASLATDGMTRARVSTDRYNLVSACRSRKCVTDCGGLSVSQSFHTPPTEHMVHTHTHWSSFFSSRVESRHLFVFWPGSHFRMIFLVPFAFTYLLLAQILMRTGPSDEPQIVRGGYGTIQPHRRGAPQGCRNAANLSGLMQGPNPNQIPPSKEIRTADTATVCQTLLVSASVGGYPPKTTAAKSLFTLSAKASCHRAIDAHRAVVLHLGPRDHLDHAPRVAWTSAERRDAHARHLLPRRRAHRAAARHERRGALDWLLHAGHPVSQRVARPAASLAQQHTALRSALQQQAWEAAVSGRCWWVVGDRWWVEGGRW